MAAPSLLHQLPTKYHHNRRRLGGSTRPPDIPYGIAFEVPIQYGSDLLWTPVICTGASRKCIRMQFMAMVKPLNAGEEPEAHDNGTGGNGSVESDLQLGFKQSSHANSTSLEGNHQPDKGTNPNLNPDPVRDGSNFSLTTGVPEVAISHNTGVSRFEDDECSGKSQIIPMREQDFWQDGLLHIGTVVAVRSKRLVERQFKNERRKWNSNKPSEIPTNVHKEKSMWLVNKWKPKLRVKARRLSPTEEAELSSSIKDLMRMEEARDSMRKVLGREPTMSEVSKFVGSDIRTMCSSLKRGWYDKNTLLSTSMGLIKSIASEHQRRGIAIEDLIQAGVLSVLRGIKKFDQSRGYRFSTYSYWWIRDGITKAVVRYSRLIRLPRHVYTLITHVRKTSKQLSENTGRTPRPDEVAESVGLTVEKLSMVLQAFEDPISLDQPFRRRSYTTYMHLLVDQDAVSATEFVMRERLGEEMAKLIQTVSPREAEVLRYRYGFENGRTMTLDEIGSIFKVSKQRIGQIESRALEKLKQRDSLDSLKHFLYQNHV